MTSDEKASFKHGLIPVWLHVTISMAGSIGGFLASFVVGIMVLHQLKMSGQSPEGRGPMPGVSPFVSEAG